MTTDYGFAELPEIKPMHTPGPWSYIAVDGGYTIDAPFNPIGRRDVCRIQRVGVFAGEPDARLIASAPELLAALIQIRDMRDDHTEDGGSDAHLPAPYECFDDWAADVASAAIAAATAR